MYLYLNGGHFENLNYQVNQNKQFGLSKIVCSLIIIRRLEKPNLPVNRYNQDLYKISQNLERLKSDSMSYREDINSH